MDRKDALRISTVVASLVIAAGGLSREAVAGQKSSPHEHPGPTSNQGGSNSGKFGDKNTGHGSGGVVNSGVIVTDAISNGGIVAIGTNSQGGLTYSNLGGANVSMAPISTFAGGAANSGTILAPAAP
jgi:hypothetical protein